MCCFGQKDTEAPRHIINISYKFLLSLIHYILQAGLSLVGWKVVMIIGAHGWGGSPRRSQKDAQELTGHCCASSRKLARVFQPCQVKHSKEFKAFKHKTWKSSNYYVSNRLNTEFASSCSCTDKYKIMSKYPSWRVSSKKQSVMS